MKQRTRMLLVTLLLLLALIGFGSLLLAQSEGLALPWLAVNGGGGTIQGGNYSASLTIGQGVTGRMTGGDYTIRSGFWPAEGMDSAAPLEPSLYLPVAISP